MMSALLVGVLKGIVEDQKNCEILDTLAKLHNMGLGIKITLDKDKLKLYSVLPCIELSISCSDVKRIAASGNFTNEFLNSCELSKCALNEILSTMKQYGMFAAAEVMKQYSSTMTQNVYAMVNQLISVLGLISQKIDDYGINVVGSTVELKLTATLTFKSEEIEHLFNNYVSRILTEGCEGAKQIISELEQ